MKKLWLAAVFLMPGLCSNAYAEVNFGFEAGDTSGWVETYPQEVGTISVVNSWNEQGASYIPHEGNYFAVLETGVVGFTTLSQKVSLRGGDTLEGWAGFCCGSEVGYPYSGDNGDYNDYALITILNGKGDVVAKPWYADSFDIGYGITTPDNQWTGEYVSFGPVQWEHWNWTASDPDSYTLQYQTDQGGDYEGNSYAFFDGPVNEIRTLTSTAVPEPSSFALIGLGVAGVFAAHRLSRFNAPGTPA